MSRSLLVLIVVTACSHADDRQLTAAEHRELASIHEAKAEAERAQFDPSQTQELGRRSPFGNLPDSVVNEYNPTSNHLTVADRELRRAAEHNKEAAKLEAFEERECASIPKEQRSACPLLASQVALVQNDSRGVRLTIKETADAKQIESRLQCHLAYARSIGFDRPTCPLFVKGMSIKTIAASVIALHGDSPEVAQQLQDQARRIFIGDGASMPVSLNP